MAQKILIRRGTEAQRLTIGTIPSVGELLYTTDRSEIFVGDGSAAYGVPLNYIKAVGNGVDQTITGNIGITGNLTVTGDVTQTTSNNVVIGDSIILLNADSADTPVNDAGFEIERGLSTNVSILWDEGLDQWLLTDPTSSRRILDTGDIGSTVATFGHTHSGTYVESITGGDSITVGGTAAIPTVDVTDGTIGQNELNVTNTGTAGLVLTSTTGQGMTWESAGAATNDSTITLTAGTGLATGGTFTTNQAGPSTITFDLDLDELSTSVLDADGDFFAVVDSVGVQKKLTKANIALSGFNNDSGFVTTSGVTSVGGTGTVSGITLNGTVTTTGNLTLGGTLVVGAAELDVTGNGTAGQVLTSDSDGSFSWTTPTTGTVTSVVAGAGMTQTGTTATTLNVEAADTSITVNANSIEVNIVDGGTFV